MDKTYADDSAPIGYYKKSRPELTTPEEKREKGNFSKPTRKFQRGAFKASKKEQTKVSKRNLVPIKLKLKNIDKIGGSEGHFSYPRFLDLEGKLNSSPFMKFLVWAQVGFITQKKEILANMVAVDEPLISIEEM